MNKILIVDDSPLITSRLIQMLEVVSQLFEIHFAENARDAVDKLTVEKWDMVLMDIHLPDKRGIELLRLIRSGYPDLKIVMISNESGTHYRRRCKTLGACYFLDKSTELHLLPQLLISLFFASDLLLS